MLVPFSSSKMLNTGSIPSIRLSLVIIVFTRHDVLILAWGKQKVQIRHPSHAVLAAQKRNIGAPLEISLYGLHTLVKHG